MHFYQHVSVIIISFYLSLSSLKENGCTRNLYCVINPLHLNGKMLSLYLSALKSQVGKRCLAMSFHFLNFLLYNYTSLFHIICLKGLYRHKRLCEI